MLKNAADLLAMALVEILAFTAVFILAWACLTVVGSLLVLGTYSLVPEPFLLRINEQMALLALVAATALALAARLKA